MTVADIRQKARRIIEDTVEPYRWTDDEIREYLQDAVRRLNSIAPHTRYMADGAFVDFVALPESDDEPIAVNDKYREALAHYVAYLCYYNDATDTVNNERAGQCLSRAEGLMV